MPAGRFERGHAVADRLDAGQGGATGRESLEDEQDTHALDGVAERRRLDRKRRMGRQPDESDAVLTDPRHRAGDEILAAGHRDGDGEHVVRHEGRGSDQPEQRPEVVLGDDVRAPARGVRLDRLPVAQHHGAEQEDDRAHDGQRVLRRRRACDHEHDEDLLGRVGHR